MTHSVAIVCPHPRRLTDLAARTRAAFDAGGGAETETHLFDDPEDALRLLPLQSPELLLIDGRELPQLSSFVARCAAMRAEMQLVVLVDVPEPTQPRIRFVSNETELIEAGLAAMNETPTVLIEQPKTVLAGMTRQFETSSTRMKQMLNELETAARHAVTILLIGETGVGKTFLSRLIHEVSPRSESPFLHVACGALPSELIESELFGHVKGAFTSAHADKDGKFLAAEDGTVLLDEIDVLGLEQQVKLLKVIETGDFEPVGSNTTHTSRARLVVASNLDLQPLVEQGKFRPDLFYRLNMLKFEIPPLRERTEDIPPLAEKFVKQQSDKHEINIRTIERSFFEALAQYPWPGNVRELENVIQRAVIYCADGILTAKQLPRHITERRLGPVNDPSVSLGEAATGSTLGNQIQVTEKEIIENALLNNNFSRTRTAKELGISRVTLYNKMKKYGVT